MKTIFFFLATWVGGTVLAQDLYYNVTAIYQRAVVKTALASVAMVSEITDGFPVNWISRYKSVTLTADKRKPLTAPTRDGRLSGAQLRMLESIEIGQRLDVRVDYQYKDPVTGFLQDQRITYSVTVAPEVEAAFEGGRQQLLQYFGMGCVNRITASNLKVRPARVRFVIDECGTPCNARVTVSTGNGWADDLLLRAVNRMPRWKPARDGKGRPVRQELELLVGDPNTGC
jgi:hypothetical protein